MDIESSVAKLLNPVDSNGTILGAGLAAFQLYQNNALIDDATNLIHLNIHLPNMAELTQRLTYSYPGFLPAVIIAVAASMAHGSISNTTIKKILSIAQKAGTGYAAVIGAESVVYSMTHSQSFYTGPTNNSLGSSGAIGNRGY